MKYEVWTSFRGRRECDTFDDLKKLAEFIARNTECNGNYYKVHEINVVSPVGYSTRRYINNLVKSYEVTECN